MKNLLVIADKLGGGNSGLKRALSLQKKSGAKITLMGFCYTNMDDLEQLHTSKLSRSGIEKKLLQNLKSKLSSLVAKSDLSPRELEIKAVWGKHIAPAICAYCKEHAVDMVIKSGNDTGTLIYTSTDWQLIRECPSPVVITTAKAWKKKPNILAAIDFSSRSPAKIKLNHIVMQQAKKLASALGERVHVAFALKVPQALVDLDLIDGSKFAKEKRRELQPIIDTFCQQYDVDSDNIHIKRGDPPKVIPSIANSLKADIVVTGTIGRKGISGKLIGNTAEAMISRLRTDVLAVKL